MLISPSVKLWPSDASVQRVLNITPQAQRQKSIVVHTFRNSAIPMALKIFFPIATCFSLPAEILYQSSVFTTPNSSSSSFWSRSTSHSQGNKPILWHLQTFLVSSSWRLLCTSPCWTTYVRQSASCLGICMSCDNH